ncbi:MAG: helix-turn-helix domain-containing protein [Pseudomonadota bacterium]
MTQEGKYSQQRSVPRFVLYGEKLDDWRGWFVNIEHLGDRCSDRGWKIEPHAHPGFGQLMFLRSGRGTVLVEDEQWTFASPCVIVLPKHTVHGFHYDTDCDGWVLTIEASYLSQVVSKLPEFSWLWSEARLMSFDRNDELWEGVQAQLRSLDQEVERRRIGHVLAAEMMLTSLFLSLVRSQTESAVDTVAATEAKYIDQFNDLVERYFRQGWKVKDYADVMGISLTQLRSICIAATGKPPIKLIHDRSITEAKRLLIFSDMTVEQITSWLCMSSPSYFTRFFKKETGQAPSHFRSESRAVGTPTE